MVSRAVWPWARGRSALPVLVTLRVPPSTTSQAQPLPNWVAPAVLNCSTKASKLPKSALIFSARAPLGWPPPPGFMHCQ